MTAVLRNTLRGLTRRRENDAQAQVTSTPKTEVGSAVAPAIEITPDDPLYIYCLNSAGVVDVESLRFASPALTRMREAGVRLLIPLVNQGELVGLMQLGSRLSDQEYSSDDFRLLNAFAPQAAAALRVAQLAYQQQIEARRRERIEQELRVAGIIQQTLLPKEIPELTGWHMDTHWQPARSVGGDFYDFIMLPDGRLMMTIGDVTDKGVPAALVMASTRSIIRAAAERLISPGEVLRRANEVLCPDMPSKMFATCLCAVLDPQTGRFQYANAGHNPPQQRTKDGVIDLRARGMPLGLMPGMSYEEKETYLAPGDTVLLYSDGYVEAHNPEREMLGMKRLQALLIEYKGSDNLISYLRDALFNFTGPNWEQEDDVTFVTVGREIQASTDTHSDNDPQLLVLDDFEAASEPGGERAVMERVADAVKATKLSSTRIERLKTAVAEATMNAMEHGNHFHTDIPVKVKVLANAETIKVLITDRDQGGGGSDVVAPMPDLEAKLAGTQSPRGWGLFLIKAMVDEMRIHTENNEHTIELMLKLEG
ncbi:MAG: SpoIIE family protein phosphatase [Anaerolineae bacterium]|nr:SpoIIE family protein phosphatase [Anaerolineae bacterium]